MYDFQKKELKNIFDTGVYNLCKECNVVLAGGAITSIFTGKEINDFDLYFKTKEDLLKFYRDISDGEYIVGSTDKSFTFTTSKKMYQVIYFDLFPTVQDIFNSFDFSVCMGAYDFSTEEFVLDEGFITDNISRSLVVKGKTTFPVISLLRVDKYKKKGYNISKKEMLKLALQVSELKFNSWNEFKQHFTGMYGSTVDVIFNEKEIGDFSIEKTYDVLENFENNSCAENYTPFNLTLTELLYKISKEKIKVFLFKDDYYFYNGYEFEKVTTKNIDELEMFTVVDIKEVMPKYLYKYVKKTADNGKYISRYYKDFVYEANKIVKTENSRGLFFTTKESIRGYRDTIFDSNSNQIIIKVAYNTDDIINIDGTEITLKECCVVEEVTNEEIEGIY
jgi:hypothetical protein